MAEEPGWRGTSVGCGMWLLLLAGIVSVAIPLGQRSFDPDRRCSPGESGKCISVAPGVVASDGGFFSDVTVRYDDGRHRLGVTIRGDDELAVGSRVRIEWWDGKVVALYDLSRERRLRTTQWPDPWWDWALFFVVCVVFVGLLLGALFGVAALVGRMRPRYAARSNGKP